MYDASKENDKDFLREAFRVAQEKILLLQKENSQLRKEKALDDELCKKLAEEFFLIKKRVFDSKQEKKANKARNQKKRKKGKLPHNQSTNLPIEDLEIDLDEEIIDYKYESECCPKCGSDKFSEMSNCHEESSEFEVIERRYLLKRHKRQKYSCKGCHNIVTAPGGVKLTPGGEFSIQIATQIVSDKFEDHIPLERQRKRMKRAGLNVEAKTLYGLTEHLYNRLFAMNELIRQDVLSEHWVHIDESPMNFYNPNKSKGYVWSMSNPRGAYYQFEPTRSGDVAREMLKSYQSGVVITDGFSGYNFLDNQENIKHVFCWAHVRRKFFEAMSFDPKAEDMVDLIDALYEVEHEAEVLGDLSNLRSKKSSLIIKEIGVWIEDQEGHYLDSTSMGKAINYYLQRREGLHYFISDHFVPIDNNMAERRQRCPVMGRKNYLHFKSINGADVGMLFYSIIESCKSNGLNAKAFINEMAHRSANNENLESPYQYSKRLNEEISVQLSKELGALKGPSE
jgi:transposase